MYSFTIPRMTAERISRLGLACADDTSAISHIGVRIGPGQVRFSATNGRMLASLIVPVDDTRGQPSDLVLDREHLAAALKVAAKTSGSRISMTVDLTEARISNGTVGTAVCRVNGVFPSVDHAWTRTRGCRWVPTISSVDPHLVRIAQKLIGNKNAVLFSSPVNPVGRLERLWATSSAQLDEAVSLADLRAAVTAPVYWCDRELAILVMPIARDDAERQLDLSSHVMASPLVATAAA